LLRRRRGACGQGIKRFAAQAQKATCANQQLDCIHRNFGGTMKKLFILIGLLLLGAAGWAGTTYVIGGKLQENHLAFVAQLAEITGLDISVQTYQRGFLSSRIETLVAIQILAQAATANNSAAPTLRLTFENKVEHGPWLSKGGPGLALIETRLVKVAPGHENYSKLFDQVPQLKESLALTRIDFSGTLSERLSIPAFNGQFAEAEITWGGLTVNSRYSARDKTLTADFSLPQLDVRAEQGSLTWAGMAGNFDLIEALPLIFVGASDALIRPLEITLTPDGQELPQSIKLQGARVTSLSSCEGNLVSITQNLEIDGIDLNDQTYGPGRCEVEVKNLDGEVLGKIRAQFRKLLHDNQQSSPDQLLAKSVSLYAELLKQSPEINLRQLHFATPQGNIDGSLQLSFDGSQSVDLENPAAMLQGLAAKAELALHETLVRQMITGSVLSKFMAARAAGQIPETFNDDELAAMAEQQVTTQIDALLAQNFVVRDGDRLKTEATFDKGELLVNGQSLPVLR
jgi:uncharacterized protein YdgA (DUF945 family)